MASVALLRCLGRLPLQWQRQGSADNSSTPVFDLSILSNPKTLSDPTCLLLEFLPKFSDARTPTRQSGRHLNGLSRLSLRSVTPMSRTSSRAESAAGGRRSMPFRTYRHEDWRQSFPTEEATSHQSQGRASGSFSRSSLMSEDSMSTRSRASQRKVKKKLRPSKTTYSVESGAQMLTSLSESSRPDLQAHRVPGFSIELDSKDFQILSEGLLEGSIFGAFGADHLKSLAPEVQLYRFAPAEAVSRKEFPCPYVFIIRDGRFFMGDNGTKECITLGPSCVFGEIDLWGLHSDLIAGEAGGTCLGISREAFLETLKKVTREIAAENYHFLLRSALFEYLDVSYLAMLSKCSCNVSYAHGAVIKEEMGPGNFMYLVKKGMVIEASASGQQLHLPGDGLGCCGKLQAEGDGTELLAWQLPSLQALLGFRGTDFFWRCALLSSLRGAWSSRVGHSPALAYRDSPEELARACIIITVFGHSVLPDCLSPASSIEWFMVLDGSLSLEVSGVSYPLKPNDSMPWPRHNANVLPTLQLADQAIEVTTTLALLMKDAVLPTEECDEEEKLRWVKQVFLFRTLDHREQQLLSRAARLVPRRRGEVIFEEGDLASQCFVVVEGEMAQWKEGNVPGPCLVATCLAGGCHGFPLSLQMAHFTLDPTFGFNCTAAFDFSELPHAAPLASLCAQHTATSLALGNDWEGVW
eukprot:s3079_g5.t1